MPNFDNQRKRIYLTSEIIALGTFSPVFFQTNITNNHMPIKYATFLTTVCILILSCASDSNVKNSTENPVDKTAQYTLEEKIGQLIMIGFRGLDIAENSKLAQQLEKGIVGGIILFDYDLESKKSERNIQSPEQVKQLVAKLHQKSKHPLFMAIDQEGGAVSRLKAKYGFTPLPNAQYLGEVNNLDSTTHYASINAQMMNELGINLNFAPVVDLNINPENPAIGKYGRSYSDDPTTVIEHAKAVIAAQSKHDVISVLKHFPGHGSSDKDSHKGIVDVTETWQEKELQPYLALAAQSRNTGVMTAHIYNKKVDPSYPATLSKTTIDRLRNEIKFDGVIFSDDMQMKAITNEYPLEEVIRLGMHAGLDVFVFGNNLAYDEDLPEKFIATIKGLLEKGVITEARIEASYNKVMALKDRT